MIQLMDSVEKVAQRATVGEMALKLGAQNDRQSVIDTQRAMQRGYADELIKCAKSADWTEPFYVCVQTRRERLLTNVIRNQFYARKTRPIPQYDLALYHYDPADENLRFVWCIPDKESVLRIIDEMAAGTLPLDQSQLGAFCKSFVAGTLV